MNYVYGGSFNPPTKAHKKIIEILSQFKSCEHVIILPVGDDYQKPYLVDFKHRYKMLNILTKSFDNVIVSNLEEQRAYHGTLNSLNELSKTYDDLCFVIGSDQLETFDKWIEFEKLLATYPFVIMQRDINFNKEIVEEKFQNYRHEFIWIPFNEPYSSTKARINKTRREEILEPKIIEYIDKHGLYKE